MWPVVDDLCDNACWLVILVRCKATGRILAYCRDCGAAWLSPSDLQLNRLAIGSELCSRGIEVPSGQAVAQSIWADSVQKLITESECSTETDINDDLVREQSKGALNQAPPRPSERQPVICSRWWLGIAEGMASRFMGRPGSVWFQGHPSMVDRLQQAREERKR
jgi:hypothetical protein